MVEFNAVFSYRKRTVKLGYKPLSAFFRANLDRKRKIWPAAWCGLYKGYPQQVEVTAQEISAIGPQTKNSIVECGHLRSRDRATRIKKNCGPIAAAVMPRIDAALKSSLGLQ